MMVPMTSGAESAALVLPADNSGSSDDDSTPSVSTDFTDPDDPLFMQVGLSQDEWNALFATAIQEPEDFRRQVGLCEDANYSRTSWHGLCEDANYSGNWWHGLCEDAKRWWHGF